MTPAELAAATIASGGLRVPASDPALLRVCSAAVGFISGLPVVADRVDPTAPWTAAVEQGAVLLAARLYRRKDTPGGVVGVGDGAPVFISRWDADITRLLRLDAPAVG